MGELRSVGDPVDMSICLYLCGFTIVTGFSTDFTLKVCSVF